ncbi:double-strand break repair helicase AddA [Citreimonas salinaria]|uniref:DNA 3'-5' helicase n=1 Tax=Citreimonas salinaria TaxID=321339 RepID=A0A1H3FCP3_9RHOB|nr:double-strand break repair helicase AddA [Citreimonas salinaria]SDX87899.1 DNA helicase/exodeoxyribonuclease V, subunit A [Citreimonas salinaria]
MMENAPRAHVMDDATRAQVRAARPDESTWLSANAGSGKTRVLTDRVARLLLDGVSPELILCLTYTKAAASEMQNRLFRRLGQWAMLDDDALRASLLELGLDSSPSTDALRRARTLFARAIETPGGLRIQTIHGFCAALLRRFPLEAGVSPQFTEIEDRAAQLLRAEVLERMADGLEAPLIEAIAPHLPDDPDPLLREIASHKAHFLSPPDDAALAHAYGLAPGFGEAALLDEVFSPGTLDLLRDMAPMLAQGGASDRAAAQAFASVTAADIAALERLEPVFFTQAGEPRKTLPPTKGCLKAQPLGPYLDGFAALADRVTDARGKRMALACIARDRALIAFAQPFLSRLETEKTLRGWLDFDDLIDRAKTLLSDASVAEWVLYRLDGGIDHILVDEAQDTSPAQWQVIESLAREFTSGSGARQDVRRTIFVVGDKKQSIYSFQGADPSGFDRMRDEFAERLRPTGAPLNSMMLEYSFRSAEPILRLVDNTFTQASASGFTPDQRHRAFKTDMPGRVDLWPVVEKTPDPEDGAWFEPVDRISPRHHTVTLARRIARFIRTTIEDGTPIPEGHGTGARAAHAGDFLILVQKRNRLFTEIIRAAKQEGLPIAGADRLKVMAELAVRDIIALLSFLATPEDDLSLATALRSPLFGLTEAQLYRLAQGRGQKFLWQALRDGGDADTLAVLKDLRDQVDYLRPYDLIERILTRHSGRRKLVGRLGIEAEDGIDALLTQALAYEASDIPSLTGFLQWAQADDLQIKRAPDSAGATLRVMTVHGAKGLEAPIVILPDCAESRSNNDRTSILRDEEGALWKTRAPLQPARHAAAVAAAKQAEAQERDRLLYVALTRAETWLIAAAAGDLGKSGETWHDKIRAGMEASGAETARFAFPDDGPDQGLRLKSPAWDAMQAAAAPPSTPSAPIALPAFFDRPAAAPVIAPPTVSPSNLGGAKALPGAAGDTEEIAKARGTLMHALLEDLAPVAPADRAAIAAPRLEALTRDSETAALAADGAALLTEVCAVLDAPDLTPFFAPQTLAEVPVTADLPGIGRIHGVIDRLVVDEARVLAVDFKSNRTVPDTEATVPDGLLRQMGAYAAALAQLYPGRRIETGLVWTAQARFMPLSADVVQAALARATPA